VFPCLFGRLLGEKDGVNVGKDTSTGNGDSSEKTVELFIVLDGKSNVTGHDTALFVVTGGVSGEFENLSAKVFEDSGEVDGGASTHSGGVLALTQVTADTTDGELQASLGRCSGGLLLSAASLSFSCCIKKMNEYC
jgi:hypothetical protein